MEKKLERLFSEGQRWCAVWGLTRLMREVTIEFSNDLGAALGRLDLRTLEIQLNGILLKPGNEALLHETLCHELAHIVASLRYGPRIKEHGPEWCEYMEKAGFKPRPEIAAGKLAH